MPAPTQKQFEDALTNAYIAKGFVREDWTNGVLVPSQELTAIMALLVKAQAEAMNQVFTDWQNAQKVLIQVTSSPGSPSNGTLP